MIFISFIRARLPKCIRPCVLVRGDTLPFRIRYLQKPTRLYGGVCFSFPMRGTAGDIPFYTAGAVECVVIHGVFHQRHICPRKKLCIEHAYTGNTVMSPCPSICFNISAPSSFSLIPSFSTVGTNSSKVFTVQIPCSTHNFQLVFALHRTGDGYGEVT